MFLTNLRNSARNGVFEFLADTRIKLYSVLAVRDVKKQTKTEPVANSSKKSGSKSDNEWINAKPFKSIPTLTGLFFFFKLLPGGIFYKTPMLNIYRILQKQYGSIIFLKGCLRRRDLLIVYDAEIFEKVFRSESQWPIRHSLDTMNYYRKEYRAEIFKNDYGIFSEQGKKWYDLRTQVNPIMLKSKNIKPYIPHLDQIAKDFVQRIKDIRDRQTLEVPADFENETNRWALESISMVVLNTRLGLIQRTGNNSKGELMIEGIKNFHQLSFELDILPSIWKYWKTPKLKKLMNSFDKITHVTLHYIKEAEIRFVEKNNNSQFSESTRSHSILEQLIKIDRNKAIIVAMDFLIGGVDTTSAALINTIYNLAKHPDKQEKLRDEIKRILPEKDTELTEMNLRNVPYLRACLKESLRMAGISNGTIRETTQDYVLAGYQIPKGTNIFLVGVLTSNEEKYFTKADDFLPERWLRDYSNQNCAAKKMSNPFAYIPFGFGPRMCIGKKIAELEIETALLRLIRNFKIEWHQDKITYKNNFINTISGDIQFKFIDIQ